MPDVLVVGMGISGEAAARMLMADGDAVIAVDDHPTPESRARAKAVGVELVEAPPAGELAALAARADVVVVSPGVPASHPVFAFAGEKAMSEVELAWRRARVPMVAVTGTNGKTTVTTLITRMLVASGIRAVAAGNIGLPLLDAAAGDASVIVAEVSSFQLFLTSTFHPAVAAWLNFAPDHLDWHPSLEHYRAAKARLWANARGDDLAIGNADDPVVSEELIHAGGTHQTFGLHGPLDGRTPHFGVVAGELRTPAGEILAPVSALPRNLPHEQANALAAAACARGAGATVEACRTTLLEFRGLPHRIELVSDSGGVRWYDDSKATTPASVVAALEGFPSVVLIAGGRNKGLDFSPVRRTAARLRAVVAIGEAAPDVAGALDDVSPVVRAESMDAAVEAAARVAQPGDVVLLSPGCASFDWYRSYAERGDDFARAVRARQTAGDGG